MAATARSLIPMALMLSSAASLQAQGVPPVTVKLEIHNGPQADRYEARSESPRCVIRGTERDTLVAAFRPNFPSAVTWFALNVPDPYDATTGTEAFRFELTVVSIGLGPVRYTIEGRSGRTSRGSGAVTIRFADDGPAIAQFAVRTAGIGISGSLTCRVVTGR